MTPPTALSPYSTAPLLPLVISMRSIESRGMVEKSTPAMSMSLSLRPLISTRLLEVANAPNPLISTVVLTPLTPPYRLVSCTPGVCAMISCTVCAGEWAISSAVMTDVDAPTMPLNCRTAGASFAAPPAGAAFGRLVRARTTRLEPCSWSIRGFARVRFSSGALISTGGRTLATCCARAAEAPKHRTGTRKVEASRKVRRRCAAVRVEDMVQPRYDVSGTSQRTKSHHRALSTTGEANVCTPRPTSSRVTTADGRSPGSRVDTLRRLPRTEIPSGL